MQPSARSAGKRWRRTSWLFWRRPYHRGPCPLLRCGLAQRQRIAGMRMHTQAPHARAYQLGCCDAGVQGQADVRCLDAALRQAPQRTDRSERLERRGRCVLLACRACVNPGGRCAASRSGAHGSHSLVHAQTCAATCVSAAAIAAVSTPPRCLLRRTCTTAAIPLCLAPLQCLHVQCCLQSAQAASDARLATHSRSL